MLDRFLPSPYKSPRCGTIFRSDGKTKTKRAGIAEVYTYIETLNLNLFSCQRTRSSILPYLGLRLGPEQSSRGPPNAGELIPAGVS